MSGGEAQVETVRPRSAAYQDIRRGTRAAIPHVTS
jgi:hypothetical protein